MTTTTTRREATIDTEIAAAWSTWTEASRHAETARNTADRYASMDTRYATPESVTRRIATADKAEETARKLWHAYAEAEARYEGWSRFFIVAGGHIHSHMACSTCNKRGKMTRFGWLPELSGLTEADAVAEHGAILCTVCFPSAPVAWTNHYEVKAATAAAAKCSGSGSYMNYDLPNRTGFYSGNYATCETCGGRVTPTSTGKLRAHKPAA